MVKRRICLPKISHYSGWKVFQLQSTQLTKFLAWVYFAFPPLDSLYHFVYIPSCTNRLGHRTNFTKFFHHYSHNCSSTSRKTRLSLSSGATAELFLADEPDDIHWMKLEKEMHESLENFSTTWLPGSSLLVTIGFGFSRLVMAPRLGKVH